MKSKCAIEVKVKVVYGGKENDIISQYVDFTKVYNEQVKLHGRSREAVTETIRTVRTGMSSVSFWQTGKRRLYLL